MHVTIASLVQIAPPSYLKTFQYVSPLLRISPQSISRMLGQSSYSIANLWPSLKVWHELNQKIIPPTSFPKSFGISGQQPLGNIMQKYFRKLYKIFYADVSQKIVYFYTSIIRLITEAKFPSECCEPKSLQRGNSIEKLNAKKGALCMRQANFSTQTQTQISTTIRVNCVSRHHGGEIENPFNPPLEHHSNMVLSGLSGPSIGSHYSERHETSEKRYQPISDKIFLSIFPVASLAIHGLLITS